MTGLVLLVLLLITLYLMLVYLYIQFCKQGLRTTTLMSNKILLQAKVTHDHHNEVTVILKMLERTCFDEATIDKRQSYGMAAISWQNKIRQTNK